jgi:formylglycine-generating enzyme required for sulfatase activity
VKHARKLLQSVGLALVCLLPAGAAQAARVALVIGNAAYADGPLRNPVNDARAVEAKLTALGFAVQKVENLKRQQIGRTVTGFASRIQPGDEVVVFYAGHGLQVKGVNYLPAVDADIQSEDDVALNSLNLNSLLDRLDEAKAGVKLLFLDACRNNPYARSFRSGARGLARVSDAPSGTLMHFATRPGSVAADGSGGNGLYTTELLRQIDQPGVPIEQMLKRVATAVERASQGQQEPWVEGSLKGDFYFKTGPGMQVASIDPTPVRPGPRGPTGGAANFGDLEQAQKEEAATKQKWAEWQARMKADYNRAAGLNGSAELEAKAWDRFLAAYAEDNPYGDEDDQLRADASRKQVAAQARAQARAQALARPAQTQAAAGASAGTVFKDCDVCPEMVVLPPGRFTMGSPDSEAERNKNEGPQHEVTINYKLAVGKFAVTFDEWQACVNGGGCTSKPNPNDRGWGRTKRPVINVSWEDAQEYVQWLKGKTGKAYRLLSEAEWEYAARAGTATRYAWGDTASHEQANYGKDECCSGLAQGRDRWEYTAPVGQFPANGFGLHDMAGNVYQWVGDVYHDNYSGAPSDGSNWTSGGESSRRVLRGGSWGKRPTYLRSANRDWNVSAASGNGVGFRIARTD